MASFIFLALVFLKICALKVKKNLRILSEKNPLTSMVLIPRCINLSFTYNLFSHVKRSDLKFWPDSCIFQSQCKMRAIKQNFSSYNEVGKNFENCLLSQISQLDFNQSVIQYPFSISTSPLRLHFVRDSAESQIK